VGVDGAEPRMLADLPNFLLCTVTDQYRKRA
jgi:hypothetical protein